MNGPVLRISGMLSAERVLVVDDDGDFADSVRELLVDSGCVVETAHDSQAALVKLALFRPNLALIDVRLGAENGAALVSKLRAQASDLVCILMTAYAALDSAIDAVHSRADDYLMKPIEPAGLVQLVRSATQRVRDRAASSQRERLEQLGGLAASTAHDLNNILTVVIAEAEELLRREAHSESLRVITDSAQRAVAIVRRLLVFARGAPVELPCLRAGAVLRQAATALRASLPSEVRLEVELASEEVGVGLEAAQLEQVVLSLLHNAVEAAMPRGTVRLHSRFATAQAPNVRGGAINGLLFSVSDTGPGIEAEVLPRVFEPFFTTKIGGAGLGLSTAYGLVHGAGGDIRVETEPGMGTRFSVWLPISEPKRESASVAMLAQPPRSVLICDDDPLILRLLQRLLKNRGYQVTAARCIADAEIAFARNLGIDTLITDLRLGNESGSELVRALRALQPALGVVVISGDIGARDAMGGVERVCYVPKPFSADELSRALAKLSASAR